MIADPLGNTPDAGFELTPEGVCARAWRLTTGAGQSVAKYVRFSPNGEILGWFSEAERSWRLDGSRLVLLDRFDRQSTAFEDIRVDEGGWLHLTGAASSDWDAGAVRVLSEIEPYGQLRPTAPSMQLKVRAAPKRRNLVLIRANERSVHYEWAKNLDEADRTWDLGVSFYGEPDRFGMDEVAEFQILQDANRKYEAIYDLLYEGSPLWSYDYVAFPDDDLVTTWRDLNEMFAISRRFRLDLAQPSLTGHVTHLITRPDPEFFLRYVSFVEPIAPWFSRSALRICAPSFLGTRSGYGLDHVWPKLLGEPRDRMAIVDQVSFEHTRPVAANYDMNDALAEAWAFQMAYDAYPRELVYGGIRRKPADFYMRW